MGGDGPMVRQVPSASLPTTTSGKVPAMRPVIPTLLVVLPACWIGKGEWADWQAEHGTFDTDAIVGDADTDADADTDSDSDADADADSDAAIATRTPMATAMLTAMLTQMQTATPTRTSIRTMTATASPRTRGTATIPIAT